MAAPSQDASAAEYLRELVREHSAIVLGPAKDYLLTVRLRPLLKDQNLASLADLAAQLQRQTFGDLHRQVIDAMTTNETLWFRDARLFRSLRERLIPELIERRSGALNVWCAACSSGQEPYSILMSIHEHFSQLAGWKIRVIASDISAEMLKRVQDGTYSQFEMNRGLPAPLLAKYFERDGDSWRVCKRLRDALDVREVNLVGPWPPLPRLDVIFLRNVLIYFDVPTKAKILERVAKVLSPDGYLVLGAAETTHGLVEDFEPVPGAEGGCYRLREGMAASEAA